MEPLLEAKGLTFQSAESKPNGPSRTLLDGVDFAMAQGETLAITGPSGSGKSTLLMLLCRILEPTAGAVFYAGKSYEKYPPRELRRHITLVFQTASLLGPTVRDDLYLGAKFSPEPLLDNCQEMLESLHLPQEILAKNPAQLSVGEAQRVALARALVIQPKILLLDEPTASLDMASKLGIEETIRNKVEAGLTVALVSHEERQVQDLAHHGIRLEKGKVVKTW
jgi:ABC-type antimicrobial peptide transport system, ATPase component